MRVHLDTDFGGDPDDACALAMLLGWPDIDILGVTTTLDREGWRAAYAAYCLGLVGRGDIPLAAGAATSLTTHRVADPFPADDHYWPSHLTPRPSEPGEALRLLRRSIAEGATIVGIGPSTNLAALERTEPGILDGVPVVIMGGWVSPPTDGLPPWGPEEDFNVQWDTHAARTLAEHADLTLATLPETMKAHLRGTDLPRLRESGPLGELLARQSQVHGQDTGKRELGLRYPGLPDDLCNFLWDPAACAVALGWPGAVVRQMRLEAIMDGETLRFEPGDEGRPARALVEMDGEGFTEVWLTAVERAQRQ